MIDISYIAQRHPRQSIQPKQWSQYRALKNGDEIQIQPPKKRAERNPPVAP